jgi:hypothetical protein
MQLLHPRYEIFCREYARHGNATEAAREAEFSHAHAANQAYRLLKRADIQARLAELALRDAKILTDMALEREAQRARLAAMQATGAEALLAKLDPVYENRLDAGDHAAVLKIVHLQARIAGLLGDDAVSARSRTTRSRQSQASSEDGLDLA